MLLVIAALLFYLFCFFLPALKLKYDGIYDSLSSEFQFVEDSMNSSPSPDFSKVAVIDDSYEKVRGEVDKRLSYNGEKNCRLFHEIYSSEYENPKICIGFGDCVKACPQEALHIVEDRKKGQSHIEVSSGCNGCGKCLGVCPESLISLVDRKKSSAENPENNKNFIKKGFKFWSFCYRLFAVVWG